MGNYHSNPLRRTKCSTLLNIIKSSLITTTLDNCDSTSLLSHVLNIVCACVCNLWPRIINYNFTSHRIARDLIILVWKFFSVRERDESSYAICLSHESRVKHYRIDILPSGNFVIQDGPKFESIIAVSVDLYYFLYFLC